MYIYTYIHTHKLQIAWLDRHTRISRAVTTQHNIHGCYIVTKTAVYTAGTTGIRRHNETRNSRIYDRLAPPSTRHIRNKNIKKSRNCA